MALEDLLLGRNLDPGSFFADADAKTVGVRFPDHPIQVIETFVCIQPLTETEPVRAIRVAMYRDGVLQSEVYRAADDGTRTWPIATPVVSCEGDVIGILRAPN